MDTRLPRDSPYLRARDPKYFVTSGRSEARGLRGRKGAADQRIKTMKADATPWRPPRRYASRPCHTVPTYRDVAPQGPPVPVRPSRECSRNNTKGAWRSHPTWHGDSEAFHARRRRGLGGPEGLRTGGPAEGLGLYATTFTAYSPASKEKGAQRQQRVKGQMPQTTRKVMEEHGATQKRVYLKPKLLDKQDH